ncbi:hypothetical protein [Pseudomonas sp. I2]|uniref:hypothetical protein n=1 Tax=Pseudomonas sp. I2 TaxID=1338438 RepID=UPI0034D416CA
MDATLIPNPRNWPVSYQMIVLLVPAISFLIGMAMIARFAWGSDFERAMAALRSSSWLELQKGIWGTTAFGSRWILLGMISGVLAWPGRHIRRGELDAHELRCFPADLKRRLLAGEVIMLSGLVLLCTAVGLYRFHGH